MLNATRSTKRTTLPVDFTLRNANGESVIYSMGSAQTLTLTIGNAAQARMTLPAAHNGGPPSADNHLFALGFAPGTLRNPENIALAEADARLWRLTVSTATERDHKRYLYLQSRYEQRLDPSETVALSLTGVQGDDRGGSHGTVVALRYRGLELAGATGAVNGVAARHLGVIHHYPADLGRLDTLIEETPKTLAGLVAQESTVKQDLAELRDELLPALVAEGGGLVMTKGSTTLTIRLRANPYFFQSQKESARLHFDSGAKLLLYCDDKLNRVSNVQIDDPKWSSLLATKELEGADKGIILNEAYGLSADDQITLTLKLMALGEPRLTSLRIRCQDVNKGSENFTLRVPLFVGPLLAVDDTLALTGQLGLGQPPDEGEAPLRLFKDDGWNFTLEDDDKSAFRIGSADAKSADGMTHFVARDGGVEIGGFETDKDTSISLRSAEAKHVGIRFQQGRVDKGFVLGTTEVISTVETAGKVESSKNQPSSAEQILLDMDWETFCHWFEEYMSTYELDADDDPLDAGEELKDRLYRHFDDEEIEVDTDLAAALGRIVDIFIDQGSDEYSVLSAIDEYKMEISRSTSGNKSISKRGNARSSGFLLSHESPGQSPSKRTDLFIDEKNGNIGVGTVQPTAELHVQGRIKDETGWVMPKGAIIMWTGDKAPEGWTLCDGTKGAPNLQSRFIVGIGPGNNLAKEQSDSLSAYGVGKKGGREYVPLTTDHLANHSHVVTDPSHTHQVINKDTQKGYGHGHGFETQGASYTPATQNSSLPANSRVQADSQRTGISIKSAGKGKAHENLPPYYALAFIMKL